MDQRATRCTGVALSVAAGILGVCVPGSGARIMAFVGGPSTDGPGAVSFDSSLYGFHYQFCILHRVSCEFI